MITNWDDAMDEGYVNGADSVRLFCRRFGSGEGANTVLLHGGPGSNMNSVWPDLEPLARGRTILAYDQRGGGRSSLISEPGMLTAECHIRDLEALRCNLGLDRLTLIGESWGAGLAALYASNYPHHVSRLLLLGPMPPTKAFATLRFDRADDSMNFYELIAELRQSMPNTGDPVALCETFNNIYLQVYFANPADIVRRRGNACNAPPEAVRNWMVVSDATFASLGDWDFLPMLSHLQTKALIVEGEQSITLGGTRAWASAMPNARLLLVPGAGHFPQVEQPALFFAAIEHFLSGSWPQDARVEHADLGGTLG